MDGTDGTDEPAHPEPDDKDWTWVLDRDCGECGFSAAATDPSDVAELLRENAAQWQILLNGDENALRTRPDPTTWSPLEYACHVRDVYLRFDERLDLMLTQDGPHFPNWDQDQTAIEARYDLSDPAVVSTELGVAADRLADRFASVPDDAWDRTGFRSDGAAFTVATFARYFIHDPIHHLSDVTPKLQG